MTLKSKDMLRIQIEDLRKLLKAESIYPRYNDFKRKIIEQLKKN